MPQLQTERLILTPFTLERVWASLLDRAELARLLRARVPDEWPLPDVQEILSLVLQSRQQDPASARWSALLIHRADRVLIGDIGFKGDPDASGTVEIGYGVVPAYRRQGYTTEAARAMITWAFSQPGVTQVAADCLPDNIGSIRVLEKLGLRRTGTRDSDEGLLLTWAVGKATWQKVPAAPLWERGG